VETDLEGRYHFEGITPGSYAVIAGPVGKPTYFPGTQRSSEAGVIRITDGVVVGNVNFTVPPLLSGITNLKGRMVIEGGTLSHSQLSQFVITYSSGVSLREILTRGGPVRTYASRSGQALLREDGTFDVPLDQGEHRIQVSRNSAVNRDHAFYVKEASFGALNLMRDSITIPIAGAARQEIVVRLARSNPIHGNVLTEDGNPATNIQIYLHSPGTEEQQSQPAAFAVTDDMGNFTFRGIRPGVHSLHSEYVGQTAGAPVIDTRVENFMSLNLTLVTKPLRILIIRP
jgi:hypothetical protein